MTSDSRPIVFLLAEDDDNHAMLVKRAMRNERIANDMQHVRDGAEAIEYLNQAGEFADAPRPDVILLDLNMPKVSGQEVLEFVKSHPSFKSIPVVILTTSATELDRARAYTAHANSYVVKPLDFKQFGDLVRDLELYWTVWNQPPVVEGAP